MFAKRNACKPQKTYNFPTTKLKNVYCTYCKHQFFLQEFIPLYGVIPLLMECGHVICEKCTKLVLGKPCPSCNVIFMQNGSNKTGLPLHIYTLGLMVSSHNRPINTNDLDVSFTKSSGSKFKQHGPCQECGIHASVKCPQCEALYCFICYNKIHGRALNSHSKIVLTNPAADDSCIVQNTCSEKCTEALGYFCEECEIAGCSHCMIRMHKGHTYVPLANKNDMFLEEFDELSNVVGQKLQRIRQAQKKLKSTIETPTHVRHSDNVETMITQHFAYLHGVLQNMEKKMLDSMHHQRDASSNNIDEILTQLKDYEERLLTAFMIINSVEGNLDKIDIQHVIKKLKKVIDIPCHLVGTSEPSEEVMRFVVDESIVDTIQKHCDIHIPAVSSFSLQRTELLPDDYEMEPLTEDINIPRVRAKSFTETDSALVSLPPRKNENNSLFPGSSEMVRVTHVVDPFCFYAQPMKNRSELLELQEGLKTLQNEPLIESSEVKINGMYAVQSSQDNAWYRGRVVNISTTNDVETYTVFFNDYGMQEENVPLTKIRNIGRFATFPMMVYRCSLFDIVPNGGCWQSSAIEAFKSILTTHDMVSINIARVNGETFFVDLCLASYKGRGVVSAKDSLTFMKHGTCVSTTKLMRMNPNSTKTYCKEELPIEYYAQCEILFVESPSCIYVRKNKACRVQFAKLAREMMEHYENAESNNYILSPYKDLPCAARDNDGYWHRGIICEVTENTVKVFFVDLGYSLILSYDDIRTLSNNFLSCKTQAIKISLKNIKPRNGTKDQWELEVVQFLKKVLKTLMPVRVIVLDKFGETHIAFIHTKDEGDISNMLIKRSLAMSTKTCSSMNKQRNMSKKWKRKRFQSSKEMETNTLEVPERLREMSKPFNGPSEMDTDARSSTNFQETEDPFKVEVIVNQVVSPDCIYVSDVMCEQSDIDKMIQQMQLFYGRFRSAEKVWKEGAVCVAFLSKDNMYYRCTIVEMKENDQALVYLYDKSVEEIVPLKDLQSLYPPFFKVPAYGFKIKLAGILPCGGSTKWPSLSCEKLKEMTIDNCNCKFYISKLEEDDVTESTIPVELWIKQKKVDGPLFPTRVEISSVNRMLVDQGVALPIKEYAKKRDKILAIELKMQYMEKLERLSKIKTNVKWFKIENGRNEANAEPESYLKYFDSSSPSPEECDTEEEFDNFPSLPKLTAWLPAKSISADKFIALPTYLDQDGYLYLHSIEQSAGILANIEHKLEKLYKHCEVESCDTVWSVGDICIAQYHGNKKWYRGKVVKILENDVFEVEFVDYGNVEECPVGTIKKHVVLENVPIQSTKCLIYGLEPDNDTGKWTTLELDKIHSILIDKKCIVSVLDRTDTCYVISVNIFVCNQRGTTTDLISFLNSCGLKIEQDVVFETKLPLAEESEETIDAIEETSDKVISGFTTVLQNKFAVDNSDNCSIATTDIENLSWSKGKENLVASTPYVVSEETLQIGYETITAPINAEYIEVELTTSISAITFYAQFKENAHIPMLNEYYKQYTQIMADLQQNASKQPMITTIKTDIACCAKFDDDIWYRCLILETNSVDDSDDVVVKLRYVDFGNFETRTINRQKSELYSLKKDWFSVPALAIQCKLWNIQKPPSEIPELMVTTLRNMYERVVIATVKEIDEEFTSIEVYADKDRKELFYGSLIDDGLFKLIVTGKDKHPPSISK